MGGDSGFLSVMAAPAVKSFADLEGRTLSVDAMTNGLAFVPGDLVARGGLSCDLPGVRTVPALRSKYGTPQKTLTDPSKYVDLTYHEKAFGNR